MRCIRLSQNISCFILAVYTKIKDAVKKHSGADVLVNFASLRSAYESTIDAMNYPQVYDIGTYLSG